jgi:hypothetical protein
VPLSVFLLASLALPAGALAASPGPAAGAAAGRGGPADAGWLDRVQQEIAAQEYELSWQEQPVLPDLGPAWHAPNRAHGLRTYFREDGIHVVPRTEAEPSWRWSLSLKAYGRGTTVWPVGEARLSPTGNRIDYGRGSVDEWYVNDPRGLKQSFRLWAAPEEAAR